MFKLHKYVSAGEGMGQRRREMCKVGTLDKRLKNACATRLQSPV